MQAFRRTDLLLPLAAATIAWALSRWQPATPLDLLFGTIMLTALLVVLRLLVTASLLVRAERRRVRQLTVAHSQDVVRRAVADERVRLSADIERCVRDAMQLVAGRASAAATEADPRELLQMIQADAARTNVELRRQLGLLRDLGSVAPTESEEPVRTAPAILSSDLLVAGGVGGLALVEFLLYPKVSSEAPASPGTVVLTLAIAGTLVGRRSHPVAAGLLCAALLMFSIVVGEPVPGGFAFVAVTGGLSWALARTGRRTGWLTLAALTAAVLASRPPEEPANTVINGLVLLVAAIGGALTAHQHRARLRAEEQATRREREIDRALSAALLAERRALARELHDSVSNAVGVVAVQAGAAELCFERDPELARQSIATIQITAEQAVAELDHLRSGSEVADQGIDELVALVHRMRAAGLEITLETGGDPLSPAMPTVYRVVQECLTNALRHAPGSRVSVVIRSDDTHTDIRVVDDGPGTADARPGFGLIGLRERVALLGGTLRCTNLPTKGLEVLVSLPFRTESAR
ncbi:MAG TPA: sensor histidine kinase [Microlunatus sp.]|nr:sensor histidine kinase [Microlunatus sp.]